MTNPTTTTVRLRAVWSFDVDAADTRLILAALGGRLKDDDVQAAKDLGDRLTRQRAGEARHLAAELSAHEANIGRIERKASRRT